jgi:cytochrome c-type biogenesis protein CcmE
MSKKIRILIGLVIILVFGYIAWTSFGNQMTPYVDFAEARRTGKTVQVIGVLVNRESEIDSRTGALSFLLREEATGDMLAVEYSGGPKPGNFEQADKIVAVGNFRNGVFHSHKLLVKCPSKYQGETVDQSGDKGI